MTIPILGFISPFVNIHSLVCFFAFQINPVYRIAVCPVYARKVSVTIT